MPTVSFDFRRNATFLFVVIKPHCKDYQICNIIRVATIRMAPVTLNAMAVVGNMEALFVTTGFDASEECDGTTEDGWIGKVREWECDSTEGKKECDVDTAMLAAHP